MVVVARNLFGKFVNSSVYRYSILAATISTSFLRIPDGRINGYFRADLFPFGINTDFAQ